MIDTLKCSYCGKPAKIASVSCHHNDCSVSFEHFSKPDGVECARMLKRLAEDLGLS